MVKFLFFITLLCSLVFGDSFKEDKNLEIISKNIVVEGNIVTAVGDVVVYSPSYYITTDKLVYDKENSTMELFGNVTLIESGQKRSFSEYLFIDTKKDLQSTKPLMLLDHESEIWFNAKQTQSNKNIHQFENTTFSSCDCIDPAWNMSFTSGDYDTEEQWLNTYNTTLYIKGVPILYTPYFGFSTDQTRRSGFLYPTGGFSSDEGILFAQPYFYAPRVDFDLEFIPQIRQKRGYGYETQLRYADSPYSMLKLSQGYFFEQDSYYTKYKLQNKEHYGWNLQYDRSKLFSKGTHKDALKIDLIDMKDIDYQNTRYNEDSSIADDKTITSEAKYFYNTNQYYSDIELKKIKDLSKNNSDDILRTEPKLNLHKYLDNVFLDNLTYSADITYDRQRRKVGLNADEKVLTLPVTYTNSFLDDYLEFSIGEELNLTQIDYTKNNNSYRDGKYLTLTHFAKLQTNLLKAYDDHIHTINLSSTYKKPEELQKKGDIYSITSTDNNLALFPVDKKEETILLNLNSSLYGKETLAQIVNYQLSQLYTYDFLKQSYKEEDLSQSIRLYFGDFSLSNDLSYSYDLDTVVLSSTSLRYEHNNAYVETYYKNEKNKTTLDTQEDLVYEVGFEFENDYTVSYKEEVDLSNNVKTRKEYTFGIDKNCWALDLKYVNSAIASNKIDNSIQKQDIVYLTLEFKPLFGLDQQYKSD